MSSHRKIKINHFQVSTFETTPTPAPLALTTKLFTLTIYCVTHHATAVITSTLTTTAVNYLITTTSTTATLVSTIMTPLLRPSQLDCCFESHRRHAPDAPAKTRVPRPLPLVYFGVTDKHEVFVPGGRRVTHY